MNANPLPLRILIAEDLADLAESLAFMLRLQGYEVELASDGVAAIHLACVFRPDVALLDIGMPKLDGFEAAWYIRQKRGNDVRLIALTAWNREQDKARAAQAGFDLHLTKPVDLDLLMKLLAELAVEKQRGSGSQ